MTRTDKPTTTPASESKPAADTPKPRKVRKRVAVYQESAQYDVDDLDSYMADRKRREAAGQTFVREKFATVEE